MKANIHPNYAEATVTCTCGATYKTRSVKREMHIGVCAACHPFFTGTQRFVDTAGRVEKFQRRFGASPGATAKATAKAAAKKARGK